MCIIDFWLKGVSDVIKTSGEIITIAMVTLYIITNNDLPKYIPDAFNSYFTLCFNNYPDAYEFEIEIGFLWTGLV